MARVGVIGLGAIGGPVARNLAKAGNDVVVYDVAPAAVDALVDVSTAARDTAAGVAAEAAVVVVAVLDDAQVETVVLGTDGIVSAARGSTVLVLSTVSVETIRAVAQRAAEHGVVVLDCCVTGGTTAAESGDLVAMIGGPEAAIADVAEVLDGFTSSVVHMGPVGAGLQAKLARNLIQYGTWVAAYEGQLLAEAAGIDLAKLARVIRESDPFIGGAARLMTRDTVEPFPADADPEVLATARRAAHLAHKDLHAALELARALDVDLPLTALAETRYDRVVGLEDRSS